MEAGDAKVQPILKWVGGKRQLLENIRPLILPCRTYYEPFVGGGAVLFDLRPCRAVVNDSNRELINVYRVIAGDPEGLLSLLEEHKRRHSEEYFYHVRAMDRDHEAYGRLSDAERAARIIYLNKTCYNGLFRVNSAGEFNSPCGRYRNPNIVNEEIIRALHVFFAGNKITLRCGDYRSVLKKADKEDFVYLDPPYMPLSESSSFTGYTADGFGEKEQIELKRQCDLLERRGVRFLLSNSACPFIEDLYHEYRVERVPAKRAINAKGNRRGAIDEVLVRNYEIEGDRPCTIN